jgi:hypothetical protein
VVRAFVNISIGDIRKVMGPMALLAEVPFLGVAPRLEVLVAVTGRQAVSALGTATGLGALGALGALAPVTGVTGVTGIPSAASHPAGASASANSGVGISATGTGDGQKGSQRGSSANPQPTPPGAIGGVSPSPDPNTPSAPLVPVSVVVSQPPALSVPPLIEPVSSVPPSAVVPAPAPSGPTPMPLVGPLASVGAAAQDVTSSVGDVVETAPTSIPGTAQGMPVLP